MRFDLDKAFGVHQHGLNVRAKRAELIASNIANADTPNYKARDIDFRQVLSATTQKSTPFKMAKTHSRHVGMEMKVGGVSYELKYRNPMQASLDGNTVNTNIEKAEFAKNAMQYQASLRFLSGRIKSIKTALKGE